MRQLTNEANAITIQSYSGEKSIEMKSTVKIKANEPVAALRSAVKDKQRGPGFAERSAKIMSKYSYTLTKRSETNGG